MMSCRKAAELTSHALDRRLSTRERLALRAHLFMCCICRNYEKQLELIRTAMTRLRERPLDREGLSPEARERIRGRLDAGER